MADEAQIPPRSFIILEDMNYARHASFGEALQLVEREHAANPTRKFIIVQLIATLEPVTTSKLTRHF